MPIVTDMIRYGLSVPGSEMVFNQFRLLDHGAGSLAVGGFVYSPYSHHLNANVISADCNTYYFPNLSSSLLTNFSDYPRPDSFLLPEDSHHYAALSFVDLCSAGILTLDTDFLRNGLVENLSRWSDSADETSQRRFWQLYDAVDRNFVAHEISHLLLQRTGRKSVWDGGPDLNSIADLSRELSARRIRRILRSAVDELSAIESVRSARELLSVLHEALIFRVSPTLRWRKAAVTVGRPNLRIPTTHDWVLSAAIHTGSSPPESAGVRPAVGRALCNSAVRNYDNETFRRRIRSANIRDEVLPRYSEARLDRRTRDHAPIGGCSQSPRRGGRRYHYTMEEISRRAWIECSRKVACPVHLARKYRGAADSHCAPLSWRFKNAG
jgi:hypothetical protein